MGVSRELRLGVAGASALAVGMLLWALYGSPPYAFFAVLKWTVAGASVAGAWILFRISAAWLPLSFLLVGSAGVHLLSKMRREDWATFNWVAVGLLSVTCVAILTIGARERNEG